MSRREGGGGGCGVIRCEKAAEEGLKSREEEMVSPADSGAVEKKNSGEKAAEPDVEHCGVFLVLPRLKLG